MLNENLYQSGLSRDHNHGSSKPVCCASSNNPAYVLASGSRSPDPAGSGVVVAVPPKSAAGDGETYSIW